MLGSCGLLLVSACHADGSWKAPEGESAASLIGEGRAAATFRGRPDSNVSGRVTFMQTRNGVRIVATVQGVAPGLHGIHIHEKGDCSASDFASAGGHWNPDGKPHGCPPTPDRHAGDLGNIEVNAERTGTLELSTILFTLGEGEESAVGKAVILHDDPDDCTTDPAGHSGGRLACAIIEVPALAPTTEASASSIR